MTYIIESICPTNNLVTLYYRNDIVDAYKWADFLVNKYHVVAEIFEEYDYRRLHQEKFYDF